MKKLRNNLEMKTATEFMKNEIMSSELDHEAFFFSKILLVICYVRRASLNSIFRSFGPRQRPVEYARSAEGKEGAEDAAFPKR